MNKKNSKSKHASSTENRIPRTEPSMMMPNPMNPMADPMQPANSRMHNRAENKTNHSKMN